MRHHASYPAWTIASKIEVRSLGIARRAESLTVGLQVVKDAAAADFHFPGDGRRPKFFPLQAADAIAVDARLALAAAELHASLLGGIDTSGLSFAEGLLFHLSYGE